MAKSKKKQTEQASEENQQNFGEGQSEESQSEEKQTEQASEGFASPKLEEVREEATQEVKGLAKRDFFYEGKHVKKDESIVEGEKKLSKEAFDFLNKKGLLK